MQTQVHQDGKVFLALSGIPDNMKEYSREETCKCKIFGKIFYSTLSSVHIRTQLKRISLFVSHGGKPFTVLRSVKRM